MAFENDRQIIGWWTFTSILGGLLDLFDDAHQCYILVADRIVTSILSAANILEQLLKL